MPAGAEAVPEHPKELPHVVEKPCSQIVSMDGDAWTRAADFEAHS